jgi:anaerobic magnesium-protoporphyrin IX monomethyl ester cyclase
MHPFASGDAAAERPQLLSAPRLDVLFVDLPFNSYELGRRFKDAWSFKQLLSPFELHLGYRYMVSTLRSCGFSADILFPARENGLVTLDQLAEVVLEIQPRVLGFTTYEGSLRELFAFIRRLKRRGLSSLVVLGGHLATFSYEEILEHHHELVDLIVLGEGEATIAEIAAAARDGQPTGSILGVAYHDGRRVVWTSTRPLQRDIDAFPFAVIPDDPAYGSEEVPLFVTTSRGCYGHCSFCRSSHFSERWRPRDPVRVVDELEQAYSRGITLFEIIDDNFMGPGRRGQRRAIEFADEIRRRGLDIRFHASCRVNDVYEPSIRALKDAGLISVSLGVESGVPRMLRTFNKHITPEQSLETVALLDRLEIRTLAYIIFFDPYMTLREVAENLEFLKRLRAFDNLRFEEIIFRKLIPVSGTPLFDQLRSDGLLRGDYLAGHSFVFVDRRVEVLADFMEEIDLRFERALQRDSFRLIKGFYSGFKENFEIDVAEQALAIVEGPQGNETETHDRLMQLLSCELHREFATSAA